MTTMAAPQDISGYAGHSANPILPGYYADPSILQEDGRVYIYATLDPWGGDALGCWESRDFKNWTYCALNWPTKAACTSPTSQDAKVWAPSVVKGRDGRFYMYVSVGSEVWVGTAAQPLGPWRNALGDKPLIAGDYKPGFHMIDAEAFIDDDGQAYLYWGSGFNWVNGRCWAVKLKPDMATFDGAVHDVTPSSYFEAPFMVRKNGRYFLMNSTGKTTEDTYAVEYAVGNSPFGPFVNGKNTPILTTDSTRNVVSPGHHAVFEKDGKDYILYHRHSIPFDPKSIRRQVCLDELNFTSHGEIEKVIPTHEGPPLIRGRTSFRENLARGVLVTASSESSPETTASRVLDDNYATQWAPRSDDREVWLQLDLGRQKEIASQQLRMEYAWKPYFFAVQSSNDGRRWETVADFTSSPATGSPIVVEKAVIARYLRIAFPATVRGADVSIFEWVVY